MLQMKLRQKLGQPKRPPSEKAVDLIRRHEPDEPGQVLALDQRHPLTGLSLRLGESSVLSPRQRNQLSGVCCVSCTSGGGMHLQPPWSAS